MEEEDCEVCAGPGWIVSFADLMTLLFALFVVLYGLKEEGTNKSRTSMVVAVREAFQEIPDEIPDDQQENPLVDGKAIFKYFKADTALPPMVKKYRRAQNPISVINEDMSRIKMKMRPTPKGVRDKAEILRKMNDTMQFKQEPDGFKIRLMSSTWYEPGQYRIKKEYLPVIGKLARMLKELGNRVVIQGHTDDIPTNDKMSNWELSALRATYVARNFITKHSFPPNMITAGGAADTLPLVPNNSEKNRQINRRVEIKVYYDDQNVKK
jgi:chemotaxis protein MotB